MIKQHLQFILGIVLAAVASLAYGLAGILNKEERINQTSKYYKSINILIYGVVLTIISVGYIYCSFSFKRAISEHFFLNALMVGFIVCLFVGGLHGILYKRKINDFQFTSYSELQVLFSILFTIGLVAYWLK